MKGPAIFLAQFADDAAPFNSLESITQWAASLGYKGVQIPTWDGRLFDLAKAAESQDYCDEVTGICADAGLAVTELSGRGYRRPALVGIGRASNHLVAASQAVPDAQALIWVAPEFYPQDAVTLANQLTAQSELAILELYSARNGGAADSRQRRAEALRAGFEGLDRQPVALQRPVSGHASGALAGRIAAWLENR